MPLPSLASPTWKGFAAAA
ncbi:hypothetical protein HBN72_02815 [Pseudomonas lundensis]|nr:hypothetical protein [Pseudomonas lundensis]HCS08036.1 hypothetical protein [Pseudomonas sp.]NLT99049.1 hypothetical protein [Pseudomonas lundensis]NMZ56636.1 hypothetical protein [Pseudomonas lundensis]NMZ98784.1 hypothetical protein [Pseudomonas lundensis]